MKKVIQHLNKNWIKYGFETLAILVGILGAQYLSNLNDVRKEKESESKYLSNLILELESQAATTEAQILIETRVKEVCETMLDLTAVRGRVCSLHNQFLENLLEKNRNLLVRLKEELGK